MAITWIFWYLLIDCVTSSMAIGQGFDTFVVFMIGFLNVQLGKKNEERRIKRV